MGLAILCVAALGSAWIWWDLTLEMECLWSAPSYYPNLPLGWVCAYLAVGGLWYRGRGYSPFMVATGGWAVFSAVRWAVGFEGFPLVAMGLAMPAGVALTTLRPPHVARISRWLAVPLAIMVAATAWTIAEAVHPHPDQACKYREQAFDGEVTF